MRTVNDWTDLMSSDTYVWVNCLIKTSYLRVTSGLRLQKVMDTTIDTIKQGIHWLVNCMIWQYCSIQNDAKMCSNSFPIPVCDTGACSLMDTK